MKLYNYAVVFREIPDEVTLALTCLTNRHTRPTMKTSWMIRS